MTKAKDKNTDKKTRLFGNILYLRSYIARLTSTTKISNQIINSVLPHRSKLYGQYMYDIKNNAPVSSSTIGY